MPIPPQNETTSGRYGLIFLKHCRDDAILDMWVLVWQRKSIDSAQGPINDKSKGKNHPPSISAGSIDSSNEQNIYKDVIQSSNVMEHFLPELFVIGHVRMGAL